MSKENLGDLIMFDPGPISVEYMHAIRLREIEMWRRMGIREDLLQIEEHLSYRLAELDAERINKANLISKEKQ